ncbi:MAG: phosphoribosylglycinamide formyltransferase [Alphaproteobacteria bacterium]|nr:phosphoribosylglycinamide formyltransferase [Alphaproteobacteria bacterium]
MSRTRVGVLISGRGSNLQTLLDAQATGQAPFEIALVLSNDPAAGGLDRALRAGVETAIVDHKPFGKNRAAFEDAMHAALTEHAIEFVALAGFMRVLTPGFVARWAGRMINIHPSLLPSFPGLHTHARALEAGVKLHGCTVHWVSDGVDEGAIIGQAAVPVKPGDTPDTLAARVLRAEHQLFPMCLALAVQGRSAQVRGFGPRDDAPLLLNGWLADAP